MHGYYSNYCLVIEPCGRHNNCHIGGNFPFCTTEYKKNYLQNPGKFSVLFVLKTYMTSSRNLVILISSAFDFDRQCCHVDVWMFLHAVLDCQVSIFHVPFQHLQLQSYISVWYAEVDFMLVICGWNLVRTVFPKKTTKVEKKANNFSGIVSFLAETNKI